MAKKSFQSRKPSGAAAIETIEDDLDHGTVERHHEANGREVDAAKPQRTAKAKADQPSCHSALQNRPANRRFKASQDG